MREILFRGKRESDGKWLYGIYSDNYVHDTDFPCIMPLRSEHDDGDWSVIRETVGQYTGLTDKNGKKIFEGDIVKITDRNVCFDTMAVIEFGNPNGLYNWGWQLKPLENKPFAMEILHWVDMEDSGAFIEVIGNIHDNPELFKGE